MDPIASLLIRQGRVLDPVTGTDDVRDLYLARGRLAPPPDPLPAGTEVFQAEGMVVTPGFVDVHVHLREPGGEAAETIASGARAAARGGFTTVVAMPNTRPPTDTPERVARVLEQGVNAGGTRVLTTACITRDRAGHALADLAGLATAGAAAFTDDGCTVQSDALMIEAGRLAAKLGLPVMDHAQDRLMELEGGVMHEGAVSARWGWPGIPVEAERRIVARDIRVAEATGVTMHIQHVSSRAGVTLIREAQARGVAVSGEATPHHLALCDEDIDRDDTSFKMNPPLRSADDRAAIRDGVVDGTLALFATDHAPHTAEGKARGFLEAPFGLVGLETAAAVTHGQLVATGRVPLMAWLRAWTTEPAKLLGLTTPSFSTGSLADLVVWDLTRPWTVDPDAFLSRSRNSPFAGQTLTGQALMTVCRGRRTWSG